MKAREKDENVERKEREDEMKGSAPMPMSQREIMSAVEISLSD